MHEWRWRQLRSSVDLRARLAIVADELARLGDDSRASRLSEYAQLLVELGDVAAGANSYLNAAEHCSRTGQLLRAAVLARLAFRTNPSDRELAKQALDLWRRTSDQADADFFTTGQSN